MTLILLTVVFLIAFATTAILFRYPLKLLQDIAGERSLHAGAIPRSGGFAIALAFFAGLVFFWPTVQIFFSPLLLAAIVLLCVISFCDDVASVSPALRLLVQLAVAVVVTFVEGIFFNPGIILSPVLFQLLSLVGLVWIINLYNFMDGMDGFAAGMAWMGFTTLAVAGLLAGDTAYATASMLVVAAVLGFGFWNLPPARIFMGDTGSILLGALAGLFSLLGWQQGLFPLWVPALVFSPFWVDASYTLLKRLIKREAFWLPHRSHFYQRWVLYGYSHRQVLAGEGLLMLACALSVLLPLGLGLGYNETIPLIWLGIYIVLVSGMEIWLTQHKK